MKSIILMIISLCMGSAIGCTHDNYAQRGAMIGGVTGSALGAAIGDASDAAFEACGDSIPRSPSFLTLSPPLAASVGIIL